MNVKDNLIVSKMTIKDRFGLPTDKGMDYVGFFTLILMIADGLSDDWKKYLSMGALVGITITSFLTRGSGLKHAEGVVIKDTVLDDDISDEDLLSKGRK